MYLITKYYPDFLEDSSILGIFDDIDLATKAIYAYIKQKYGDVTVQEKSSLPDYKSFSIENDDDYPVVLYVEPYKLNDIHGLKNFTA